MNFSSAGRGFTQNRASPKGEFCAKNHDRRKRRGAMDISIEEEIPEADGTASGILAFDRGDFFLKTAYAGIAILYCEGSFMYFSTSRRLTPSLRQSSTSKGSGLHLFCHADSKYFLGSFKIIASRRMPI